MILWIFCLVEIVFSKDDFWGISFFFYLFWCKSSFQKTIEKFGKLRSSTWWKLP